MALTLTFGTDDVLEKRQTCVTQATEIYIIALAAM